MDSDEFVAWLDTSLWNGCRIAVEAVRACITAKSTESLIARSIAVARMETGYKHKKNTLSFKFERCLMNVGNLSIITGIQSRLYIFLDSLVAGINTLRHVQL